MLLPLSSPMYDGEFDHGGGGGVAAVEAVEDNLSAKAAGNESVDGRMTAWDDKIGWRTTTQEPTNKRQRRWRQREVGGSLAAAARRRWRQRGGSSTAAAAVAAAQSATSVAAWRRRGGGGSAIARCWWHLGGGAVAALWRLQRQRRRRTARRRQAMDGARARAIDGVTAMLRQRNARWTATEDQKGRKTSSLAAAKRGRGNVLRLKRIDGARSPDQKCSTSTQKCSTSTQK